MQLLKTGWSVRQPDVARTGAKMKEEWRWNAQEG